MLTGEIKVGDKLLLDSEADQATQIRVSSIMSFYGESVILISINDEKPVQVSEEFLRECCRRANET